MQRRTGGAGEAGAGVEDDAGHAERAGGRRPHTEDVAAEVDALIRDERVGRTIAGQERCLAARVVDLRGSRREVKVAGGAVGRRDDAAGGIPREGGGGRSAGALDHGPRPDDPVHQGGGSREDDLLGAGRTKVGVRAFEGEGGVGGTGQRTEGESGGLAATVDGDDRRTRIDRQGTGTDVGNRGTGEVGETKRAGGDGECRVGAERTAGRGGTALKRAGGDGDSATEGIARRRGEDHGARTDLGEASGTGGRPGDGDVAAGLRRHVDPAGQRERAGEELRAGVETTEGLGAAGRGVLERATDRPHAGGEDLGERSAAELDRCGAVAEGGVIPRHDVTVADRRAAGIGVGAVQPENALLALAEVESAGDDAVDGEHASARAQFDGAAEGDVACLEPVAVEAVEIQRAAIASADGMGASVTDGQGGQDHDAVLVAGGLGASHEQAGLAAVVAGRTDAGVREHEGPRPVETELQAGRAIVRVGEIDRRGGQPGRSDMAEDETTLLDVRASIVGVVRVEHQDAAFTLAEILGAGAAGVDDPVDRHDSVDGRIRVVVTDVEVEIAGRAEVRGNRSVQDEVEGRAAVRPETDHAVTVGVAVSQDEPTEQERGVGASLEAGGADVGRGRSDIESTGRILGVDSSVEARGQVKPQLAAAKDDASALSQTQGAIDAGLQDAARANGHRAGETLRLRDIDDAVGVQTVILITMADDEGEGSAQDVGAGDREGTARVDVPAETESGRRAAGRRKSRAGEHGVAGIGAEPGLDVRCDGSDLTSEVGLEIIEPAEGDRHAAGVGALIIGDEEIQAAAEEVAARGRERTERDAGAGAVSCSERKDGRGVVVRVLEDDELAGADVGRGLDAQAGTGVDLDIVARDVRARGTGAGQPELAFLDHRAAGVGLRTGEPEDAATAPDETTVRDVTGDEADGAAARGGGVTVQADMPGFAAEIESVDQGDGVRRVTPVQREDTRVEERRTPDDRLAGAAEVDVDGRAIGAEARADPAKETHLPRAGTERAGEVLVGLISRLLGLSAAKDEVRGRERRGRRAGADDVAEVALGEIGRSGVGRSREERGQPARRLDERDGVRAVVRDDGGDRVIIPGEVVEMVISFGAGRQERDADDVAAAAGEQAAAGDDEGGVSRAGKRAAGRALQVERSDGRGAGADGDVAARDLDMLGRRPGADGGIHRVIGGDERGVTEAPGTWRDVFEEFGVGIGPAADESDVRGQRAIKDLIARRAADPGRRGAVAAQLQGRGRIRPRDRGEAQRTDHRSIQGVAEINERLATRQRERPEQFVPVHGVLSGRGVVEGIILETDTAAARDDRRVVADTVGDRQGARIDEHLQDAVPEREGRDVRVRIIPVKTIADVDTDFAEQRGDRAGVSGAQALQAETADAVMRERRGADHARSRAEADETRTAHGKRGVEIPGAVQVKGSRQVILYARGAGQVDRPVDVGAVGAHIRAQRPHAIQPTSGEREILDQGHARAAGVDRPERERGAGGDGRTRRTKQAERIVSVRLPRRDHHARPDVRGAGTIGMTTQEQHAGACLGQAAGTAEDAA